ncbi:MAG: hypothetical protein JJU45_02180 [Acidimicrobiia bacterium]|nr:hypothetical protein [Acidimicrobiia bacterium]
MPASVRRATAAGAVVAMVVATWFIFAGTAALSDPRPTTDFFDEQARAWLDGRWDLPPEVLSVEAFVIDGKAYTYFGPVPAALRLPVLVATDAFDGRLSQVSMMAATAVLLWGVAVGWWRLRAVARPGTGPPGPGEHQLAAASVAFVGCGTVVLAIVTQSIVYHEAIAWGMALATWAFVAQVSFLADGRSRHLLAAGVLVTAAVLTRASVGGGPLLTAGLMAAVWVVVAASAALSARRGGDERLDRLVRGGSALAPTLAGRRPDLRQVVGVVAVVMVAVGGYATVNQVKFGHPLDLPVETMALAEVDPNRRAALEANDGSLFGARFVPTTAWQYLRPHAVEVDGLAPWLTFPRDPATIVGDVTFDAVVESSSLTALMPLPLVLVAVGFVAAFTPRRRRRRDSAPPSVAAVRLPLIGAGAGAALMFVAGFIANRYMGDAIPLVVVGGLVGLHVISRWIEIEPRGQRWRRPLVILAAIAAVWGVAVNVALALEYQRVVLPWSLEQRYDFVVTQHRLDGHRRDVPVVEDIPAVGQRGEMVVVGECTALLWADGDSWFVIEGTLPPELVPPPAPDRAFLAGPVNVSENGLRPPSLCRRLTS